MVINTKSLTIVCFLILCFFIIRAPASLIERIVNNKPQSLVKFSNPSGTLWQGSGIIKIHNSQGFNLTWSIPLSDLIKLSPKVLWRIEEVGLKLDGESTLLDREIATSIQGQINSDQLNKVFRPYDVLLDGDLLIRTISFTNEISEEFLITSLQGILDWTGGPVSYVLSKTDITMMTPALQLNLSDQPSGVIHATLDSPKHDYPLLIARLSPKGMLNTQVSKAFTKLLGNEWPGRASDEQVVLELEERIF